MSHNNMTERANQLCQLVLQLLKLPSQQLSSPENVNRTYEALMQLNANELCNVPTTRDYVRNSIGLKGIQFIASIHLAWKKLQSSQMGGGLTGGQMGTTSNHFQTPNTPSNSLFQGAPNTPTNAFSNGFANSMSNNMANSGMNMVQGMSNMAGANNGMNSMSNMASGNHGSNNGMPGGNNDIPLNVAAQLGPEKTMRLQNLLDTLRKNGQLKTDDDRKKILDRATQRFMSNNGMNTNGVIDNGMNTNGVSSNGMNNNMSSAMSMGNIMGNMTGGAPPTINLANMMGLNNTMMNNSPNMMNNNPNMMNTNPNMMSNNPNIMNTNPNMMNTSPNMMNTNPNMMNTSSNMMNTNPNMMNTSPNMMNTNASMPLANSLLNQTQGLGLTVNTSSGPSPTNFIVPSRTPSNKEQVSFPTFAATGCDFVDNLLGANPKAESNSRVTANLASDTALQELLSGTTSAPTAVTTAGGVVPATVGAATSAGGVARPVVSAANTTASSEMGSGLTASSALISPVVITPSNSKSPATLTDAKGAHPITPHVATVQPQFVPGQSAPVHAHLAPGQLAPGHPYLVPAPGTVAAGNVHLPAPAHAHHVPGHPHPYAAPHQHYPPTHAHAQHAKGGSHYGQHGKGATKGKNKGKNGKQTGTQIAAEATAEVTENGEKRLGATGIISSTTMASTEATHTSSTSIVSSTIDVSSSQAKDDLYLETPDFVKSPAVKSSPDTSAFGVQNTDNTAVGGVDLASVASITANMESTVKKVELSKVEEDFRSRLGMQYANKCRSYQTRHGQPGPPGPVRKGSQAGEDSGNEPSRPPSFSGKPQITPMSGKSGSRNPSPVTGPAAFGPQLPEVGPQLPPAHGSQRPQPMGPQVAGPQLSSPQFAPQSATRNPEVQQGPQPPPTGYTAPPRKGRSRFPSVELPKQQGHESGRNGSVVKSVPAQHGRDESAAEFAPAQYGLESAVKHGPTLPPKLELKEQTIPHEVAVAPEVARSPPGATYPVRPPVGTQSVAHSPAAGTHHAVAHSRPTGTHPIHSPGAAPAGFPRVLVHPDYVDHPPPPHALSGAVQQGSPPVDSQSAPAVNPEQPTTDQAAEYESAQEEFKGEHVASQGKEPVEKAEIIPAFESLSQSDKPIGQAVSSDQPAEPSSSGSSVEHASRRGPDVDYRHRSASASSASSDSSDEDVRKKKKKQKSRFSAFNLDYNGWGPNGYGDESGYGWDPNGYHDTRWDPSYTWDPYASYMQSQYYYHLAKDGQTTKDGQGKNFKDNVTAQTSNPYSANEEEDGADRKKEGSKKDPPPSPDEENYWQSTSRMPVFLRTMPAKELQALRTIKYPVTRDEDLYSIRVTCRKIYNEFVKQFIVTKKRNKATDIIITNNNCCDFSLPAMLLMMQFWMASQDAENTGGKEDIIETLVPDLKKAHEERRHTYDFLNINRVSQPVNQPHFTIRTLDLSGNALSDLSVLKVIEYLRVWRVHVTELNLAGNSRVTWKILPVIQYYLGSMSSTISTINFEGTGILDLDDAEAREAVFHFLGMLYCHKSYPEYTTLTQKASRRKGLKFGGNKNDQPRIMIQPVEIIFPVLNSQVATRFKKEYAEWARNHSDNHVRSRGDHHLTYEDEFDLTHVKFIGGHQKEKSAIIAPKSKVVLPEYIGKTRRKEYYKPDEVVVPKLFILLNNCNDLDEDLNLVREDFLTRKHMSYEQSNTKVNDDTLVRHMARPIETNNISPSFRSDSRGSPRGNHRSPRGGNNRSPRGNIRSSRCYGGNRNDKKRNDSRGRSMSSRGNTSGDDSRDDSRGRRNTKKDVNVKPLTKQDAKKSKKPNKREAKKRDSQKDKRDSGKRKRDSQTDRRDSGKDKRDSRTSCCSDSVKLQKKTRDTVKEPLPQVPEPPVKDLPRHGKMPSDLKRKASPARPLPRKRIMKKIINVKKEKSALGEGKKTNDAKRSTSSSSDGRRKRKSSPGESPGEGEKRTEKKTEVKPTKGCKPLSRANSVDLRMAMFGDSSFPPKKKTERKPSRKPSMDRRKSFDRSASSKRSFSRRRSVKRSPSYSGRSSLLSSSSRRSLRSRRTRDSRRSPKRKISGFKKESIKDSELKSNGLKETLKDGTSGRKLLDNVPEEKMKDEASKKLEGEFLQESKTSKELEGEFPKESKASMEVGVPTPQSTSKIGDDLPAVIHASASKATPPHQKSNPFVDSNTNMIQNLLSSLPACTVPKPPEEVGSIAEAAGTNNKSSRRDKGRRDRKDSRVRYDKDRRRDGKRDSSRDRSHRSDSRRDDKYVRNSPPRRNRSSPSRRHDRRSDSRSRSSRKADSDRYSDWERPNSTRGRRNSARIDPTRRRDSRSRGRGNSRSRSRGRRRAPARKKGRNKTDRNAEKNKRRNADKRVNTKANMKNANNKKRGRSSSSDSVENAKNVKSKKQKIAGSNEKKEDVPKTLLEDNEDISYVRGEKGNYLFEKAVEKITALRNNPFDRALEKTAPRKKKGEDEEDEKEDSQDRKNPPHKWMPHPADPVEEDYTGGLPENFDSVEDREKLEDDLRRRFDHDRNEDRNERKGSPFDPVERLELPIGTQDDSSEDEIVVQDGDEQYIRQTRDDQHSRKDSQSRHDIERSHDERDMEKRRKVETTSSDDENATEVAAGADADDDSVCLPEHAIAAQKKMAEQASTAANTTTTATATVARSWDRVTVQRPDTEEPTEELDLDDQTALIEFSEEEIEWTENEITNKEIGGVIEDEDTVVNSNIAVVSFHKDQKHLSKTSKKETAPIEGQESGQGNNPFKKQDAEDVPDIPDQAPNLLGLPHSAPGLLFTARMVAFIRHPEIRKQGVLMAVKFDSMLLGANLEDTIVSDAQDPERDPEDILTALQETRDETIAEMKRRELEAWSKRIPEKYVQDFRQKPKKYLSAMKCMYASDVYGEEDMKETLGEDIYRAGIYRAMQRHYAKNLDQESAFGNIFFGYIPRSHFTELAEIGDYYRVRLHKRGRRICRMCIDYPDCDDDIELV